MTRILIRLALGTWLLSAAAPALAHPLGNFTTNVHVGLEFGSAVTEVLLVVDMAEIPAFRETGAIDQEGSEYASQTCINLQPDLSVVVNGSPLQLTMVASYVDRPPGEGGLATLRLECGFQGPRVGGGDEIVVDNQVFADRLGWAEITVSSSVDLVTDLTSTSPSAVLRDYPPGPPLSQRIATLVVGSAPAANLSSPVARGPIAALGSNLSQSAGLVALAVALGLGVVHALAPGHGKTLMAAYLVGQRGTPRQAVALGLSVAVAHTLGVAVLGAVTLLASSTFQPDRVYPWLTAASAGIVTVIGLTMLVRAFTRRDHHHHDDHGHHHDHHDHNESRPIGWRSLAVLGLAGGMVPSASAVVLLLGGISTGQPWFGLALVACFGIGMSLALVAAGLAALGISRFGWKLLDSEQLRHRWQHLVPRLAGVAVTTIGLFLVWNAATGVA